MLKLTNLLLDLQSFAPLPSINALFKNVVFKNIETEIVEKLRKSHEYSKTQIQISIVKLFLCISVNIWNIKSWFTSDSLNADQKFYDDELPICKKSG